MNITNATFEVVNRLYPRLKTKKQVLAAFSCADLDTQELVMVPRPVSMDQRQAEIMVQMNEGNRRVSPNSMYQFRIAFENKKFYRTGDCFMVTKEGNLVNGGCRNTAFTTYVKDPKARLPAYLLLEVDHEVVLVSDQSRKRGMAAQLQLANGLTLDRFMANVTKMAGYCHTPFTGMSRVHLGMTEYEAYATPRMHSLRKFSGEIRAYSNRAGMDTQGIHRALWLIFIHEADKGEDFINAFYTSDRYESLRDVIRRKVLNSNPLMNTVLANAYHFFTGKKPHVVDAKHYFMEE